jgi:hypothetical protein
LKEQLMPRLTLRTNTGISSQLLRECNDIRAGRYKLRREVNHMPYGHRKLKNGKVEVYKKDSGKRVGVTTPDKLKGYLAALHIHSKD